VRADTQTLGSFVSQVRDHVGPEEITPLTPYVGLEHIEPGGGATPTTAGHAAIASNKLRFRKGDILYGRLRPYLRKVAIAPCDGVCTTEIIVLRPSTVDARIIRGYLLHPKTVETAVSMCEGANLPRVSADALLAMRFSIPASTAEHQRIAEAIETGERLIARCRNAVALTEDLLRAVFLEMFGDPTHGSRWERVSIAGLVDKGCSLVDGPFGSSLKPERYTASGVHVIRNCNIVDDEFDRTSFKYVSRDTFGELRRSDVEVDDVLMTIKGTVGDVCLMPNLGGPAILSATGTCRLRLSSSAELNPEFVSSQMTTSRYKEYIKSFMAGSAQPYVNLSAVRKMELIRPPLDVQRRFISRKTAIRATRQRQREALAESERLFAALQHRAFQGEL
jgi:type I restriction enzyme S subunit